MATIVGAAVTSVSRASRTSTTTVTFPNITGSASGDVAYLFMSTDGGFNTSPPSGWTSIFWDNVVASDYGVASKTITSDSDYNSIPTDGSYSPGNGWNAFIVLVRGTHTVESQASDSNASGVPYVPSLASFSSGDISFVYGSADDQSVTMTAPTGWTLFDAQGGGSTSDFGENGANNSSAALAYKVSAGGTEGGAAGTNTFGGASSDGNSSIQLRLSGIDDPDAGGEDALLANDVESASEVTTPSIGQEHSLAANDVSATSEVSTPTLAQVASEVNLLADDVESASEVSVPALGQEHALAANDVESASEVTAPALGQEHTLTADDVESASEVTAPAFGQVHVLFADDIEAASEVTAPALGTDGVVEPPVGRGDDAPGMRYGNEREGFWRKKADDWLEEYLDRIPEVAKQPKRKKRKLAAEFEAEFAKISQEFMANSEEIPARVDAVAGLIEQLKQPSPDYSALAAMVADIQAQIQADRTRRRRKRDIEAVLILAA